MKVAREPLDRSARHFRNVNVLPQSTIRFAILPGAEIAIGAASGRDQ